MRADLKAQGPGMTGSVPPVRLQSGRQPAGRPLAGPAPVGIAPGTLTGASLGRNRGRDGEGGWIAPGHCPASPRLKPGWRLGRCWEGARLAQGSNLGLSLGWPGAFLRCYWAPFGTAAAAAQAANWGQPGASPGRRGPSASRSCMLMSGGSGGTE